MGRRAATCSQAMAHSFITSISRLLLGEELHAIAICSREIHREKMSSKEVRPQRK